DLRRQGVRETGRHGLPAESVLRCVLLKQQRQLSYEELAFHLEDSASFRAFARLPLRWSPKKSVLHQTIAAIRAETWETINHALLVSAKQDRLESGATVRVDSTVTGSDARAQRQHAVIRCGAGHNPAVAARRGAAGERRRSHGAIGGAWPRSGPAPSSTAAGG